jgi:hypothetical protein
MTNPALLPLLDLAIQNEVRRLSKKPNFDPYTELEMLKTTVHHHPYRDGETITGDAFLVEHADVFVCGGTTPKDKQCVIKVFSLTAKFLAVMSFFPHGVSIFGGKWESHLESKIEI